jgi:hypothetical protein
MADLEDYRQASEVSYQFLARNFYPSWSRALSARFRGANPRILQCELPGDV